MGTTEKQSFVMYASFLEAAENLDPAAFKECILKLRDYALYGENVCSNDPVVNIILTLAKPNLNAAAVRYQQCVENGTKGKDFGSRGGRPRKGESREEYLERKNAPMQETPRKPLNVDENEKENENRDVERSQSPAAMEPTRGSGSEIGLSLSIPFNCIFEPGSPNGPSQDELNWILRQIPSMTKSGLIDRYEHDIDKVAIARANGGKYRNEELLATEAALILQRYENSPSLDDAKKAVVKDINAAIQLIRQERAQQSKRVPVIVVDDECEKPF